MHLSTQGVDFIVGFENKLKPIGDGRYKAYRCPAGKWTIYAGCTEGVHEGMIVTEAVGKAMFAAELDKHEKAVTRLATVELTQGQYDALVSFSYNVGSGALARSTLLKKMNAGDAVGASHEFMNWSKARKDGKGPLVEMRGLVRRRRAEAAMFLSDMPDSEEMPQAAEERRQIGTPGKLAAGGVAGTAALEGAKAAVNKGKEIRTVVEDAKGLVPPVPKNITALLPVGAGLLVCGAIVFAVLHMKGR